MNKRLFVGRLSWDTTDTSLQDFFSKIGTVEYARVITDPDTGRSKGFGFVEMSTGAEAQKAIDDLNDKVLDGRNITVSEARERTDRGGNPGRRGFQSDRSRDRRNRF